VEKLHSYEQFHLFFSLNIVRVIKSREMSRTCSTHFGIQNKSEKSEGKSHLTDLTVDGRIILKLISKKHV